MAYSSNFSMFCQYCLNVRNLYACRTLADIKVLVTTEGFMSEVRSWSVPAQQLSGRPTVAGTNKLNSLIFIRSKTPLYLVMTDQSASITSSLLSRFWWEQHQKISFPTHPPKYRSSFVQGWDNTTQFSLGAVHSENGFEIWRLHYIVNVTSSARNQAEWSI